MSHQAISEFVQKVESDETLRERIVSISGEGNWVPTAIEVAREMGYEFDQQELQSYIMEHYAENLSDEMLDKVAGGSCNSTRNP